tara:strand:- start:15 stop:431 length:417 start_codon:yes stop_codon:yes gene_type:complete
MKKTELKDLIKECVKEVLFEDGVLSNIVSEIMIGVNDGQRLIESKARPPQPSPAAPRIQEEETTRRRAKLNETRKRMADAIGKDSFKGVFENIDPISKAGSPNAAPSHSPLANTDPTDAGININGIMNVAGNAWKRLK